MMGYGNVDRALTTLETAISQADYLAGDSFTAADLYVGSHLNFGMMFGTIDKRPAFERYVGRLTARPAFARARQLDDELMQRAAG
jgi:glutathione S-transferase